MRAAALLLCVAACGRGGDAPGEAGGPCYGNRTCNDGLLCNVAGICVDPSAAPGAPCSSQICSAPAMVVIDDFAGGPFWIDAFEASLEGPAELGSRDQDLDDDLKLADARVAAAHARSHGFVWDDDGGEESVVLTEAAAVSRPAVMPALRVTFYQAAAACTNAGKRLCSPGEWAWACRGGLLSYEYSHGTQPDGGDEAGLDCWVDGLSGGAQPTGTASNCHTPAGGYDMVGNVSEIVDYRGDSVELRGGNFLEGEPHCSSTAASQSADYGEFFGFRCCADP
jgi:hypothetical protein